MRQKFPYLQDLHTLQFPNNEHQDVCLKFLQAGYHSQKPLAINLNNREILVEEALRNHCRLRVACQRRTATECSIPKVFFEQDDSAEIFVRNFSRLIAHTEFLEDEGLQGDLIQPRLSSLQELL